MYKPLRDMTSVRVRASRLLAKGDFHPGSQGAIDAALEAAQPVVEATQRQTERLRAELAATRRQRDDLADAARKILEILDGPTCQFWACPGPEAPFEPMVTCRACAATQALRTATASSTRAAPRGDHSP
jgi:hypothetical protein